MLQLPKSKYIYGKQKEKGIRLLKEYASLLTCPICKADTMVIEGVFSCLNGHNFDISKKGYVNLFGRPSDDSHYDKELFTARRKVFESGFFKTLTDLISSISYDSKIILDAGCGEGSILSTITSNDDKIKRIGVDISKISISQASDLTDDILFLVADLAHIPLKDSSCDCIINILSPANYSEFARLLKSEGKLIKVIPGPDYLVEIRNLLGLGSHNNQSKSLLKQNLSSLETKKIYYKQTVTDELFKDICRMTPLTIDNKIDLKSINPINKITIDLDIYMGKYYK